jgi:hypothetical protein
LAKAVLFISNVSGRDSPQAQGVSASMNQKAVTRMAVSPFYPGLNPKR